MGEAALTQDVARRWGLAALADEAGFDRLLDTVAAAIADRFTLKAHQNLVARRMAYIAWIERLSADNLPAMDYRAFVTICAGLIASIARHRVVSFSAMIRDPHSRMIGVVLKYPNEVVALAAGASLYQLRIGELTGEELGGGGGLPAIVVENAAANLARHSEAASRFRELLQLHTPWV
ncbi:MAG TPA: hypothetical protein VG894_07770 [Bauldia sp.]|nr:hypothetical protein [Bauldia sp.]